MRAITPHDTPGYYAETTNHQTVNPMDYFNSKAFALLNSILHGPEFYSDDDVDAVALAMKEVARDQRRACTEAVHDAERTGDDHDQFSHALCEEIGETLPRYGIAWRGPTHPIASEMTDGYWTPWHAAMAEIERLRAQIRQDA